jgi:hypothetical protein
MNKKPRQPERVRSIVEQHPVALTDRELISFGLRLAETEQHLAEHEARAEAARKDLKAQETRILAERSRLASIVRNRAELRDVKVGIWRDVAKRELFGKRDDTGEETMRRQLRDEELQMDALHLMLVGADEEPEADE